MLEMLEVFWKNNPGRWNDLAGFAEEIVNYILNELEGGDWRERYEECTEEEREILFAFLVDAFGDSAGK
jgi:hypothetical protein